MTKSILHEGKTKENTIKWVGINNLKNGINVQRSVEYIFSSQKFIITDKVKGNISSNDIISSNWLLHKNIKLDLNKNGNILCNDEIKLEFKKSQKCEIVEGYYCPQYGLSEKTDSIISNFAEYKNNQYISRLILSRNTENKYAK
jgi:hypothetical protein